MEIICKNYDHYNRSLNKRIRTKQQYTEEMKRQGMVSQDEGNRIAEKAKQASKKPYVLSKESESIIRHAHQMSDSKGNVKLSDRMIDAMKRQGVSFEGNSDKYLGKKGGFK